MSTRDSGDKKYVYFFGRSKDGKKNYTEGDKSYKVFLGGKGANMAEMTNLGLPVPPGFTLSAESQDHWVKKTDQKAIIDKQVAVNLKKLEDLRGEKLGDMLFVSVRSGAAVSMPGMMDTILNLGITDAIMPKFIKTFGGNARFCWDSYRRFVQMFGNIACGIDIEKFEHVLESVKKSKGIEFDKDLKVEDLQEIIRRYKVVFKEATGNEFPQDPRKQLDIAISAVFESWDNDRAVAYRRINKIFDLPGTAVNVQTMVYGNVNDESGTGVAFTRDPANGKKVLFGEFLINAQGEDVVAGLRTPIKIAQMEGKFPECFKYLNECCGLLEKHYKHIQDMEFTIQDKQFFFLQTRNGKMTMLARSNICVDMVKEGLITEREALMQITPDKINHFLHHTFDPKVIKTKTPLGKGIAASPGAAVGAIVFNNEEAVEFKEKNIKCILVRTTTSPEDLIGMHAAEGILTSTGGRTSHAAVVARGMGKCCVCGFGGASVSEKKGTITIAGKTYKKGEIFSLDGTEGTVYSGEVDRIEPELPDTFKEILKWEEKIRKMEVWTNADTPHDAQNAINFGAQGIGLTRTEHMFFAEDRIRHMREMILAPNDQKGASLAKLKPYQVKDFYGIFKVMNGLPVTIRLLDPPLHEFLPDKQDKKNEITDIAKALGVSREAVLKKIDDLHECNPMLGHRGCRLGITFPEITIMQCEAIYEAAYQARSEGTPVWVDIMIPLINSVEEYVHQADIVHRIRKEQAKKNEKLDIKTHIGTMIETPRAALLAKKIAAAGASFFSFGTNDLTQMTMGFSRDDSTYFVDRYCELGLMKYSPFQVLDQDGVGYLVKHAVDEGRKASPGMKIGICGEHGGEPMSVKFCYDTGLNYVSCSPFRILIARMAACQAQISKENAEKKK